MCVRRDEGIGSDFGRLWLLIRRRRFGEEAHLDLRRVRAVGDDDVLDMDRSFAGFFKVWIGGRGLDARLGMALWGELSGDISGSLVEISFLAQQFAHV
jgi:hypothetical protein